MPDSSMRRDALYLNALLRLPTISLGFSGKWISIASGKSELIRSAVVQTLAIIGGAAARTSDELTVRFPQIPWPQIGAFRNILIHAYFGIDWNEVCKAARVDCPALRGKSPTFWQQSSTGRRETLVIEEGILH